MDRKSLGRQIVETDPSLEVWSLFTMGEPLKTEPDRV
jgi:hypothetical protein